jgi:hypothetical protein
MVITDARKAQAKGVRPEKEIMRSFGTTKTARGSWNEMPIGGNTGGNITNPMPGTIPRKCGIKPRFGEHSKLEHEAHILSINGLPELFYLVGSVGIATHR